jgi:hypothetical protein
VLTSLKDALLQWRVLSPAAALLLVDRLALEARGQAQLLEFAKSIEALHLPTALGALGEQWAVGVAPSDASQRVALVDCMGAAVQAHERGRSALEARFGAATLEHRSKDAKKACGINGGAEEDEEAVEESGLAVASMEALAAVEADLLRFDGLTHDERDGVLARLLAFSDQHHMRPGSAHPAGAAADPEVAGVQ